MWFFKGIKINKENVKLSCITTNTERERERTWQNPDTPAIDCKLEALARKASNGI